LLSRWSTPIGAATDNYHNTHWSINLVIWF
jgi:hypothetical protein